MTSTTRLQGVASSDVTQVTYSAPKAQGTATLSSPSWSTTDIPLALGDNVIQVVGITAAGERSTSTVDVVYNPTLSISALTLTPPEMLAGTPAQVQASLAIDNVTTLQRANVTIHQVDAVGTDLGVVAAMQDSGVTGSRRTFTATFTVTAQAPQTSFYRVFAPIDTGNAMSEIRTVRAYRPISLDEAQAALDALDHAWQIFNGKQKASRTTGLDAALASLSSDPSVDQLVAIPGDSNATVYFKSGIIAVFDVISGDVRGGGPSTTTRATSRTSTVGKGLSDTLSFEALTGCGFTSQFGANDESPTVKAKLDSIASLTVCRSTDQACGVEFFSSLGDKRVIHYAGHGDALIERNYNYSAFIAANPDLSEEDAHLIAYRHATPIIITGESASAASITALGAPQGLAIPGQRVVISYLGGSPYYAIRPEFIQFEYMYEKLKKSVVMMATCRSAGSEKMALAFLQAGASTYVGFDRPVHNGFASSTSKQFIGAMADGAASGDASSRIEPKIDPVEGDSWFGQTKVRFFGDPTISIDSVPDVTVTPASAQIDPASPTNVRVTAGINNVDTGYTPSPFTYHWSCNGAFGHLEDDNGNKGTDLTTLQPAITWVPDACPMDKGRDAGSDGIDLKVMLQGPCTDPKEMASAASTVSVDACPSPSPSPSPSASPCPTPKWTISAPASATSSTPITITAVGPVANNYNWTATSPTGTFQDQFNHTGRGSLTTTSPSVTYFNTSGPVNVTETISLNIDSAPQGIVPKTLLVAAETCHQRPPVMSVCANDLQVTGTAVPGGAITLSATQVPGLVCGAGGILLTVNGVPGNYSNLGGGTLQGGAVYFPEPPTPTARSIIFLCSSNKLDWFGLFPCASASVNAANFSYHSSVTLSIPAINWP